MTRFAIISDIHGCLPALEQTLSHLQDFKPDYYLLLGDLLNHGPRNPIFFTIAGDSCDRAFRSAFIQAVAYRNLRMHDFIRNAGCRQHRVIRREI